MTVGKLPVVGRRTLDLFGFPPIHISGQRLVVRIHTDFEIFRVDALQIPAYEFIEAGDWSLP